MRIILHLFISSIFTFALSCRQDYQYVSSVKTNQGSEINNKIFFNLTEKNSVLYPKKIRERRGQISDDQNISVLQKIEQNGDDNDWGTYKDFTPNRKNFIGDLIFKSPVTLPEYATLTLDINYRGWNKAEQRWEFFIFNYKNATWDYIGDNVKAKDWEWTLLTFKKSKNVTDYLSKKRIIKLRVKTRNPLENALFDYVALTVNYSEPEPSKPVPPEQNPGSDSYIWGVTVDSISKLGDIKDSLSNLAVKPTTRIVFDEWIDAKVYTNAAREINEVSYVMGELLDSFYVKDYSLSQYEERTIEYLEELSPYVDMWEIGNEINGEWLGNTSDTVEKFTSAFNLVEDRGEKTAITLYYNEDCWEKRSHEMFTWVENNIPLEMKLGLDYVLVSYYDDDCNNLQPNWPDVFERVGVMFPNSKIGLGEVGSKYASKKLEYINKYYNLKIDHPRFVGGYFWWYFKQDMVPGNTKYWDALNSILLKQ